jgi:hypothetical protein
MNIAEQFNGCIMLLMNIGTQVNIKAIAGDNAHIMTTGGRNTVKFGKSVNIVFDHSLIELHHSV